MEHTVVNGTSYHVDTPKEVIEVLERLRENKHIVYVKCGDPITGRDWMEEYDIEGRLGRSTGTIKIPLLVPKGESGGAGISTNCIVKIVQKSNGKVLYQHPLYNRPEPKLDKPDMFGYVKTGWLEDVSGSVLHARFKTMSEANKWLRIMSL